MRTDDDVPVRAAPSGHASRDRRGGIAPGRNLRRLSGWGTVLLHSWATISGMATHPRESHPDTPSTDDTMTGALAGSRVVVPSKFPMNPNRRQVLGLLGGLGGIGLLTLAGCGGSEASSAGTRSGSGPGASGSTSTAGGTTATTGAATTATECVEVPEETGGPYPADGTNGPDVLTQNGVVRSDIRSSFGSYSGTAAGTPLTMKVRILNLDDGCAPFAGAAIYAWHCDANGLYSLYSQGATNANFLRGVQTADADGNVTFTTVFPGAYQGRYPHVHFEVYPTVNAATSGGTKLVTSQMAMPEAACNTVYATSGYESSARNFPQTPLSSDMVFRDGVAQQLATVTGSVGSTLTSTLTIAVSGGAV